MSERAVWTYFITRDSLAGVLSAKCGLWWIKPTRKAHDYRTTWVPTDAKNDGYLGEYDNDTIRAWFHTTPDDDNQMIRAEQYAPEEK